MLKKTLRIFILILAVVMTACDSKDEPTPPDPNEKDEASRTVLVYMIASNNLGNDYLHFDRDDLDEMLEAAREGGLGDGRLLVYHNPYGTDFGNAPQLLEVTPDGLEVLKSYPDDPSIYSTGIERMREVIADMKNTAPAESYGLVLWGHAKGWMTESGDIVEKTVPRSYGHDRGKWMSLTSLAKALDGERFDFLYIDCCLMGTVEVVYELRNVAPVIAASPTEVEGEGMPYQLNVPMFLSPNPDMNLAAKNSYEYHLKGGRCCQMVVVNTDAIPALASASRAIYAIATGFPEGLSSIQILSQRFDSTSAQYGHCRPVYDFESYMQLLATDNPQLLQTWQKAYDACISYKASTPTEFNGIPVETYGGLGSFIIKKPTDTHYRGYNLTQWWADVASAAPAFQ